MIDINYDFRDDVREFGVDVKGRLTRDPDKYSKTLQKYHQFLWSKKLPNGTMFKLEISPNHYLYHKSEVGEFSLASDAFVHTYADWKKVEGFINEIPGDVKEAFMKKSYSIGGNIVYPSNRIGKKMTMNGARGFSTKIADRMDLTLECLRRYYLNEKGENSLLEVIERYHEFFKLFETFKGYVEFFLFQDLVSSDFERINFLIPFDDFNSTGWPKNKGEYEIYRKKSIEFVDARNRRIEKEWSMTWGRTKDKL